MLLALLALALPTAALANDNAFLAAFRLFPTGAFF
jgi:hypothetical protein